MSTALNDSHVRPAFLVADEIATPPLKATKPGINVWAALGWVVVWIAVVGFIPFFFVGLYAALTKQPLAPFVEGTAFAGQILGAALGVFLLVRKHGRRWLAEVGLNRLPVWQTLLAIVSVPGVKAAMLLVVALFGLIFGADDPMKKVVLDSASQTPWWLLVLVMAVGPAINEELWFRGLLGRGLVGRYGPFLGVFLASALFGLAHLNVVQGAYAFVMGLWLHLAYRLTRSLWIPILVHFLNNAMAAVIGILIARSGVPQEAAATADASETAAALVIAGVAVFVTATATWGMYALRVREADVAK